MSTMPINEKTRHRKQLPWRSKNARNMRSSLKSQNILTLRQEDIKTDVNQQTITVERSNNNRKHIKNDNPTVTVTKSYSNSSVYTPNEENTSSSRNPTEQREQLLMANGETHKTFQCLLRDRLTQGMCPTCGTQIYDLSGGNVTALTRPGQVQRGRCIYCYPNTNADAKIGKNIGGNVDAQTGKENCSINFQSSSFPSKTKSVNTDKSRRTQKSDRIASQGGPSFKVQSLKQSLIRQEKAASRLPKKMALDATNNSVLVKLKDSDGLEFVGSLSYDSMSVGYFAHVCERGKFKGQAAIYQGEFKDGKFCGDGVYTDVDGYVYEGGYVHSKRQGQGIATWPNKSYEGSWHNDEMDGFGHLRCGGDNNDGAGTVYLGEFEGGLFNGTGSLQCSKKEFIYKGEWSNGKFHGKGEWRSTASTSKKGQKPKVKKGVWIHGDFVG